MLTAMSPLPRSGCRQKSYLFWRPSVRCSLGRTALTRVHKVYSSQEAQDADRPSYKPPSRPSFCSSRTLSALADSVDADMLRSTTYYPDKMAAILRYGHVENAAQSLEASFGARSTMQLTLTKAGYHTGLFVFSTQARRQSRSRTARISS